MKRIVKHRDHTFAKKSQAGFTLIELMITLAIGAILATYVVPSFNILIKRNQLTSQANVFVAAMNLARSEAITRSTAVNVVANGGGAGNLWGGGWNITSGAQVLKRFPAIGGTSTLDSAGGVNTFTYASTGRVNVADVLSLCDDRTAETGRTITISTTGRVSTADLVCP